MVTMENYEEYLLLHADGELGPAEEKALEAFMAQQPELRREMELYMATKTLPDMKLVYEGKDALLKKPQAVPFGRWKMYAAAACIAILVVLGVWKWNRPSVDTNVNIVQVHNNNINITAPKDTFTGKQNTVENKTAQVSPEPEIKKAVQPSVHKAAVTTQYAKAAAKKVRPAQESIASMQVLPLKTMPAAPVVTAPRSMDLDIPVAEAVTNQPTENEASGLLARLPIKQEGISAIANAVNTKIEKVRNLRDNIRNTDLSVRLGNKELFTVKL